MEEPERTPTSPLDLCLHHPPCVQPGEPEDWRTLLEERTHSFLRTATELAVSKAETGAFPSPKDEPCKEKSNPAELKFRGTVL